jgi:hypothetical protein
MAAMIRGPLEATVHVTITRIFRLKHLYSAGMVTAVFLPLPISLYTIICAVHRHMMAPASWLFAFLYMLRWPPKTGQVAKRDSRL